MATGKQDCCYETGYWEAMRDSPGVQWGGLRKCVSRILAWSNHLQEVLYMGVMLIMLFLPAKEKRCGCQWPLRYRGQILCIQILKVESSHRVVGMKDNTMKENNSVYFEIPLTSRWRFPHPYSVPNESSQGPKPQGTWIQSCWLWNWEHRGLLLSTILASQRGLFHWKTRGLFSFN
jgi:hypothetical protein